MNAERQAAIARVQPLTLAEIAAGLERNVEALREHGEHEHAEALAMVLESLATRAAGVGA